MRTRCYLLCTVWFGGVPHTGWHQSKGRRSASPGWSCDGGTPGIGQPNWSSCCFAAGNGARYGPPRTCLAGRFGSARTGRSATPRQFFFSLSVSRRRVRPVRFQNDSHAWIRDGPKLRCTSTVADDSSTKRPSWVRAKWTDGWSGSKSHCCQVSTGVLVTRASVSRCTCGRFWIMRTSVPDIIRAL